MSNKIKKIPLIGKPLVGLKNKLFPKLKFESSEQYWKDRYKTGGNSGEGSYSHLAEFKAKEINNFLDKYKIESAIEYGCGDGNQLKPLNYKQYIGFDISPEIIGLCKDLFKNDDSKSFFVLDDYSNQKAQLTLSLDVIFHLVENEVFEDYMVRLFDSSEEYVMIYASNFDNNDDYAAHVRHRKFTNWIDQNRPEFKLILNVPNPYRESDKDITTTPAEFFVFEKTT